MRVLITLIVVLAALWCACALWYQLPGGRVIRILSMALWMLIATASVLTLLRGQFFAGLLIITAAAAAMLFWWQSMRPSNIGTWADDVAQMTTGSVEGSRLSLRNVRNFDWRSDSNYTQRWEARTYNLADVRPVDMILSYWTGPAIAHLIVSFGFDGGDYIAFSVEVRNRRGTSFDDCVRAVGSRRAPWRPTKAQRFQRTSAVAFRASLRRESRPCCLAHRLAALQAARWHSAMCANARAGIIMADGVEMLDVDSVRSVAAQLQRALSRWENEGGYARTNVPGVAAGDLPSRTPPRNAVCWSRPR